jgi:hypothetical protein
VGGRVRHAGHMKEITNVYRILVDKPEGKRTLRRPRLRWEDNIKMDLKTLLTEKRCKM